MVPLEDMFAVSHEAIMDEPTMRQLVARGHSRVPIYHGPDKCALTHRLNERP